MYGKVFLQLYDSTLVVRARRGDWEVMAVWPHLIALADKHGDVDMPVEALANKIGIPEGYVVKAIELLEEPDPDSRSSAAGGRRLVRLSKDRPWGWHLVNYEAYAKIRDEEGRREYQRDWARASRASQPVVSPRRVSTMSTHTDTDTDTDIRKPLAQPDGFATFWSAYPRKKSKGDALKAFTKLKPDIDLRRTILSAIQVAKAGPDWRKDNGQFIPYPASWLNSKGWEDDLSTSSPVRDRTKEWL
jgi:hypothetical protein